MPFKVCLSCLKHCGPRTLQCSCGANFTAKVVETTNRTFVPENTVMPVGISPGQSVMLTIAGRCPIKPRGEAVEDIIEWGKAIFNYYKERHVLIAADVIIYWSHSYWPCDWLRLRNVREIIKEIFTGLFTEPEAALE